MSVVDSYRRKVQEPTEQINDIYKRKNLIVAQTLIEKEPSAVKVGSFGRKILAKDSSRRYWKRDNLNVNDIPGASLDFSKRLNSSRNVLDTSDIPGTSPNISNKHKKSFLDQSSVVKDSMDVSDINGRRKERF